MADLGGTFDPSAVKDDRQLIPDGEVLAQIFESDLIDNKSGTGKIAKFGWEIINGQFQGRKLWTQENVSHSNVQAQEIGQRNLKRICEGAGVGPIRNTEDLHFKPMLIKIGHDEAKNGYDASNKILGYKFYGPTGSAPPAPAAQTGGNPQPNNPPASGVPWPTR